MTRLLRTLALVALVSLAAAPAMAQVYNPFGYGTVWAGPYQNQIYYPSGGWNAYNYNYMTNYGYYPTQTYPRYTTNRFNTYHRPHVSSVAPGTTISVPTPAGPIKVDHIGVPGLQNVITLPPGATAVGY
jgi:hypothetical protein